MPQRRWAVLTMTIAIGMAVLDGAIANVALPTIARDLGTTAADTIWVVNAYQLAVTMTLLPLAALGDILGYRRIYITGLAIFTAASLACAAAPDLAVLILARIVQGIGAAGVMSVNIALVRFVYPRALLGRGVGTVALVVAIASAAGPSIASAILSVAAWPWLFVVNGPLGLVALLAAGRSLPATPRSGHRFDSLSALLSAATFGLLITGVDALGHGGGPALAAAELAGAAAIGAVLVRRQLRLPAPLLPVDLLRLPVFALSVVTSICSFAAQGLAYVSLPFYFEDGLHRSQSVTGLLMTPWPLAIAVVAPISGRLADRYNPGLLGGIGLAGLAAGLAAFALLPAAPGNLDIAWRMGLCGLGFGLFQAPNNKALISSAPPNRSGGASGMQSTARLLGQTLGTAVVALAFGLFAAHATRIAITVGAVFAGLACVASLLRVGRR